MSDRPPDSVDPKLLEILVCPLTKTPLEYDAEKQELISRAAKLKLTVRNTGTSTVPDLTVTINSFLRPVIVTNPASSISPTATSWTSASSTRAGTART